MYKKNLLKVTTAKNNAFKDNKKDKPTPQDIFMVDANQPKKLRKKLNLFGYDI